MRIIIAGLFVALCAASTTKRGIVTLGESDTLHVESGACPEYTHAVESYRDAIYNFTIETFKHAFSGGPDHFIISPHSMWMTLAAVAEGADPANQQQLFQLLSLPSDPCLRKKYYQLAKSRYSSSKDASLVSRRALVIDEGVLPNPNWRNYVTQNSLLEVISAPIKQNPAAAAEKIRQLASANLPNLKLQGNSVLLDTVDYSGLWTTAFNDAVVKRAPFYSPSGEHIGAVDLMRVKRRAKIGYLPALQSKLIELPIGQNGQYVMIISVEVGDADLRPAINNFKGSIFREVLELLKESKGPIDIAVPQFKMNSEIDAKSLLEDLGVTNLWTDPEATRFISDPPALPSSYVQRSTVTVNKNGVNPEPPTEHHSPATPTSPENWTEFIADRPFMVGLYDTETYTCLMTSVYTQPTYPK